PLAANPMPKASARGFLLRFILHHRKIGKLNGYRDQPHLYDGLLTADLPYRADLVILFHHDLVADLYVAAHFGIARVEFFAYLFVDLFFLLLEEQGLHLPDDLV